MLRNAPTKITSSTCWRPRSSTPTVRTRATCVWVSRKVLSGAAKAASQRKRLARSSLSTADHAPDVQRQSDKGSVFLARQCGLSKINARYGFTLSRHRCALAMLNVSDFEKNRNSTCASLLPLVRISPPVRSLVAGGDDAGSVVLFRCWQKLRKRCSNRSDEFEIVRNDTFVVSPKS